MSDADVRAVLAAEQERLAAELTRLSARPADTGGIAFGKRVGEGTAMAVERLSSVATHDALTDKLATVEAALARLDAGTYGRCERCGAGIPPGRLEVRPSAALCVACS